jgi:hypothetical protein
MHLGKLTAARRDLGLATLPEFPPREHDLLKLAALLATKHHRC